MYTLIEVQKNTGSSLPPSFWIRDLILIFLHMKHSITVVGQRIQKMILHQILNMNLRIKFVNKGLSIIQKLHVWYDSTSSGFGPF